MIPYKQGQICKIILPSKDENSNEAYLIIEDLSKCNADTMTQVVSLTDLQRNVSNPTLAPKKNIKLGNLDVVAENLNCYVESWNN